LYDYGARFYDPSLGRFFTQDRFAEKYMSLSPYQYAANNPVLYIDVNGDSIFIDQQGYITRKDLDDDGNLVDNLVFITNEDGSITSLGELTKGVDADSWYQNLVEANAEEADGLMAVEANKFRNYVKKDGKWDYKNLNSGNSKLGQGGRKEHLLGLAFSLDKDTDFSFNGESYRSEDLNNHHFGVVGKAFGYFPETFMLEQAGRAEMGKWRDLGKEVPASWQPTRQYVNRSPLRSGSSSGNALLPPYGDNPIDHRMIKKGFEYYKNNF
jgi:hypothetical protein